VGALGFVVGCGGCGASWGNGDALVVVRWCNDERVQWLTQLTGAMD